MGSKGGGGTTVNNTQPPQQVLDAYTALLARGNQVASTPYTPYTGQQVASLTPLQNQGVQTLANSAGAAQPYYNQAQQLALQSAQPIAGNIPQYSQANLQQYQDPYQQQVIQATQANLNQNDAVQQQQLLGSAISSGASPFGGDRAGVAAAELSRQQDLANNQTIAGLQSQGFQNAQTEFNTQQQTQLQAQNADAARQAQASYLEGGLGTQAQSSALQGGLAQLQGGNVQQQQAQNELNVPYQQYLQQQAYPFATTQFLGNLTEGLGSNSGETSTTTAPGLSQGSTVAGGALAGAGTGFLIGGPLGAGIGAGIGGLAGLFKDGGKVDKLATGGLGSGVPWINAQELPIRHMGHTMPSAPHTSGQDSGLGSPGNLGTLINLEKNHGTGVGIGDQFAATQLGNSIMGGGAFAPSVAGLPWLGDAATAAEDVTIFAKRGGGIGKYADGGDILDEENNDTFDMASEDIDNLGATQNDSMAQAHNQLDDKPVIDHSGNTTKIIYPNEEDTTKRVLDLGLPSPKGNIPVADTAHTEVKDNNGNYAIPLLAAGLGILASGSPNTAVNIGRGGMEGLQAYAQQEAARQKLAQQDIVDKRAEQAQQISQQRADVADKRAEQQVNYQNQMLKLNQQKAEQGKYSMVPGIGQDDKGNQIQGTYIYDSKTGESEFRPGMMIGKGTVVAPGSMSQEQFKQQVKDDSKRLQAYESNKPVIENVNNILDSLEPNLKNFDTGSGGEGRLAAIKGGSYLQRKIPGFQNILPADTQSAADAGNNIQKGTNDLVNELGKFQHMPGQRGSVLGLKILLASKPGLEQEAETNQNIVSEIRNKVNNYALSEELASQYKEANPDHLLDSKVESLDRALKTQYPLQTIDAKTGKTVFNKDNMEKIRQVIPDAVRNPDKYLNANPVNNNSQSINNTGAKLSPSEDDINFTAQKYHMTPAQVKEKLGIQ